MKYTGFEKIRIKDVQILVSNLGTTSAWNMLNYCKKELGIVPPEFLSVKQFCDFYKINFSFFSFFSK